MANYQKSENYYISGKVSWFRPFTTNQWNKYSVQIHPDAKSLDILRDLQSRGLKNIIKKDDDGYYCSFTRPTMKVYRSGKTVTFTPVEVFDTEGNPFNSNVQVGNGTDATLKIEVYGYEVPGAGGKGIAARWVSARIDNLVPFNTETDYTEEQKAGIEGLKDQPEQLF